MKNLCGVAGLAASLALLAGCPSGLLGERPQIDEAAAPPTASGDRNGIEIAFDLRDDDRSTTRVEVAYQVQGDPTWHPATLVSGSPGSATPGALAGIPAVQGWTSCLVTWDSYLDGVALDVAKDVTIRLTAYDIDGAGGSVFLAPISIDNNYPELVVAEGTVDFGTRLARVAETAADEREINISNGMGAHATTLSWNIAVDYGADPAGWLVFTPGTSGSSTTETDTVTVEADVDGLPLPARAQAYTATLTITGTDGADPAHGSPRYVSVSVTVRDPEAEVFLHDGGGSAPPALAQFVMVEDATDPAPQSFSVMNDGDEGSVLVWDATDNLPVGADPDWLTGFDGATGGSLGPGASSEVAVAVDGTGLAPGVYSGSITISGTEETSGAPARGGPRTVAVSLRVLRRAEIQCSTALLNFSCYLGKGDPSPQDLQLTNPGASALVWTATDDLTSPDWLTGFDGATGGTLGAGLTTGVTVSVDVSGIVSPGTYEADITISGTDATDGLAATGSGTIVHVIFQAKVDYSLSLQPDDCVVFNIGSEAYATTGFTWECWVKIDDVAQANYCFAALDTAWGQDIWLAATGTTFGFAVYGDEWNGPGRSASYSPPGGVVLGRWYHLAGVADYAHDQLRIYVDGQFGAQGGFGLNPISRNMPVFIGKHGDGFCRYAGIIDEVRVWNSVRTAAQISAAKGTPLTGTEPGLVAYWDFNEGSGQVVGDRTGNGHDGTLGKNATVEAVDPTWSSDNPW